DLPAGEVDGLEAGPHLLDRLATGQRAERVDVVLAVQQLPQPLRAPLGERVPLLDGATELDDVLRGVAALDAEPPGIAGPRQSEVRSGTAPDFGQLISHRFIPFLPCRVPSRRKNSTVAHHARGLGGICDQKKRRISASVKPVTASLSDGSVDLVTLGQRLRHLRKSKGMTLEQLSEAVGRAPSQLSVIENGKREPKLSVLQAVAAALGVSLQDLLR